MKHMSRLFCCLLLFTLFLGLDDVHKGIAQTPPPISPRIEWREQIQNLAYYPDPTPISTYETSTLEPQFIPYDLNAWSFLTFQSYRDGNWEIYLASGNGENQQRLTADPASDIHPRLNRGCTHVVFASRRTGNYEIFSMRLADRSVKQLTFTPSDDVNPVWSPDGTKIAFQAYRDGQAEVYVMNADGSGQTRLTVNTAYDGEPAWSPDGSKIAFVSTRAGTSHIWVMNSDGNGAIQLSTQTYSENPAWSPDGKQIAYDADGNGDGWQEIWVMNADGSYQHCVYAPLHGQTDAWVGGWSPFAGYLAFTRISFIYYQGNWYWTAAYLYAWDSNTGDTIPLSNQETDWNPDWQPVDDSPPTASIEPLPAYSRHKITLRWSAKDNYSSTNEIYYDVQYRENEVSDWVDWQMGTAATSADFQGIAGHTYTFRLRAIDRAHNVGTWFSPNDRNSTTFYAWKVISTVQNNRGIPIRNVGISTEPQAFEIIDDDSGKTYTAYVAETAPIYSSSWLKSGYGIPNTANFDGSNDDAIDIILPPIDNVVQDSGFEAGAFISSPWMLEGELAPTYIENVGHTGSWAIALGPHPASNYPLCVEPISAPFTHNCGYHSIQAAIDAAEYGKTVWVFPGHYTETITMKSGVSLISVDGPANTIIDGNNLGPIIIMSADAAVVGFTIQNGYSFGGGGIIVSHTDDAPVLIKNNRLVNNRGGSAGAINIGYASPKIVGNWFINNSTSGTTTSTSPCIEGSHGSPDITNNVFWNNLGGECISFYYQSGGTIYNNTFVGNHGGISVRYQDIRNNIIINSTSAGIGGSIYEYYECPTSLFYNDVWNNNPNYASACSDQTGKNGNISAPLLFLDALAGDFRLQDGSAGKDAGDPQASFNDPDGSRNDMGAWGGPEALSARDLVSPVSLWTHKWLDLSPWSGETISITFATIEVLRDTTNLATRSALSQQVVVTDTLVNPTLSFMYRTGQEFTGNALQFAVIVTSDTLSNTQFLIESSDTNMWVYLDEVTLGSSYPDLWARGCAMNALPGEQAVCTLTYGNQGGVTAEDGQLIVTLPENVLFEAATPAPRFDSLLLHWIWDLGDIPAQSGPLPIVITTTVAPTATAFSTYTGTLILESATPEVEIDNNTAALEVFIGRRVYLPLTLRRK